MRWNTGQVVSLEELTQPHSVDMNVVMSGRSYHIGEEVELRFFSPEGCEMFEGLIAGFSFHASKGFTVLIGLQIGQTPYYAVVEPADGIMSLPGEIQPWQQALLEEAYKEGSMKGVVEKVAEFNHAAREEGGASTEKPGNMEFTHTHAPQSQVDRSGEHYTPAVRKNHLTLAVSNQAPELSSLVMTDEKVRFPDETTDS